MNTIHKTIEKLSEFKLVPILLSDTQQNAVAVANLLMDHRLPVIEILFQTDAAKDSIKLIRAHHPNMLIGAGTILTPALAKTATNAGADFLVAPGFNPRTIDFCIENNMPFIPGVDSPSLIEAALDKGLRLVKFYPAQASGGIKYLKAIAGPYKDIRFMPTGGINPDNLTDYLNYEKVVVCGASWIAPSPAIASGDFSLITQRIGTVREITNNV